jgi:hypothetical protein
MAEKKQSKGDYVLVVVGWSPWRDVQRFSKYVRHHFRLWGKPRLATACDTQTQFDQMARQWFLDNKIPFHGYVLPAKPEVDPVTGRKMVHTRIVQRGELTEELSVPVHVLAFPGPTSRASYYFAHDAIRAHDVVSVIPVSL